MCDMSFQHSSGTNRTETNRKATKNVSNGQIMAHNCKINKNKFQSGALLLSVSNTLPCVHLTGKLLSGALLRIVSPLE